MHQKSAIEILINSITQKQSPSKMMRKVQLSVAGDYIFVIRDANYSNWKGYILHADNRKYGIIVNRAEMIVSIDLFEIHDYKVNLTFDKGFLDNQYNFAVIDKQFLDILDLLEKHNTLNLSLNFMKVGSFNKKTYRFHVLDSDLDKKNSLKGFGVKSRFIDQDVFSQLIYDKEDKTIKSSNRSYLYDRFFYFKEHLDVGSKKYNKEHIISYDKIEDKDVKFVYTCLHVNTNGFFKRKLKTVIHFICNGNQAIHAIEYSFANDCSYISISDTTLNEWSKND